jgi:hypothetical protein
MSVEVLGSLFDDRDMLFSRDHLRGVSGTRDYMSIGQESHLDAVK